MRALIKTNEGYRYRGTFGEDHVFTSKTDYDVQSAIDTVVDAELAEATDDANTVAMAAGIIPRHDDDTPFEDFDLGDAVSVADIDGVRASQRVVALPVRESPFGVVQYGLEVGSRIENDSALQRRWLDAATPGSLSGRSDQISAANLGVGVPFGTLRTSEVGVFNQTEYVTAELDYDDPEDPGHSDDWPVDEPILIYRVRWSLQQAGDTATVVHVRINNGGPFSAGGVHFFHGFTIPAGETAPDDDTNDGMYTNMVAFKGDTIRCAVYQAGNYARGLVVRVKYTSQT